MRRADGLILLFLLLSTLKGMSGKVKIDEIDVKPNGEKIVSFREAEDEERTPEIPVSIKGTKVGPDLRVEIGYRKGAPNQNQKAAAVDEEYETVDSSSKTASGSKDSSRDGKSLKAAANDVAEAILAEADRLYGTLAPEPDSYKQRNRGPRRRFRRKRVKEVTGKSSKWKKVLIILLILLILLLLILIGGGLCWCFWGRSSTNDTSKSTTKSKSQDYRESKKPSWFTRQFPESTSTRASQNTNSNNASEKKGEEGKRFWSKWRK